MTALALALDAHRRAASSCIRAATRLHTRLSRFAEEHRLARTVLVIDDDPAALMGLAATLAPLAPVHAVTHLPTEGLRVALEHLDATLHVTTCCGDAAEVWERERCAVVVVDAHLDGGDCGASVLERIGRGPRAVLVSSRHESAPDLAAAARLSHAVAMLRTDTGAWQERLRDVVARMLDEATAQEE
jgi:CheY-like chemotaxis protein